MSEGTARKTDGPYLHTIDVLEIVSQAVVLAVQILDLVSQHLHVLRQQDERLLRVNQKRNRPRGWTRVRCFQEERIGLEKGIQHGSYMFAPLRMVSTAIPLSHAKIRCTNIHALMRTSYKHACMHSDEAPHETKSMR